MRVGRPCLKIDNKVQLYTLGACGTVVRDDQEVRLVLVVRALGETDAQVRLAAT